MRALRFEAFLPFFLPFLVYFNFCPYAAWASRELNPECSKAPGTLPDSDRQAGRPREDIPIQNIVVIMQENHSFDSYLGRLNEDGYAGQVDGVTPGMNHSYHETRVCTKDPKHNWNAQHAMWNHGKNDQFEKLNGRVAMGYHERAELPFYYALANQFAIGDRYFSSAMGPTYPNRFFFFAATAFGHLRNDEPAFDDEYSQRTLFDLLDLHHISWKYYTDGQGYLYLFGPAFQRDRAKMRPLSEYQSDLEQGRLPQVSILESLGDTEDEHPPANIQVGQAWVSNRVRELMKSSSWEKSVLFLTYDENGGFFDHVPPPLACAPGGDQRFNRLGFRVPFFVVSPFAKHHYVSHQIYDHTSILKFIETKFNLPALTVRDANANDLTDFFDFSHPVFDEPVPDYAAPTFRCKRH